MIKINPLFVHPLFKSSLPLLFGGSYHLLKALFSNSWLQNLSNKNLHHDGLLKSLEIKQGPLEVDLLTLLDQISFGIYTNFFAFLFAMLLIDIFLKIVKHFWIEAKSSSRSRIFSFERSGKEWKLLNLISESQIKRIFCYMVIFMTLQIIGIFLSLVVIQNETFPPHHASQSLDKESISPMNLMDQENQGIARILEESDEAPLQDLSSMVPDKLSLSMGDILSSLDLAVNAMVLSKDKKIAFVTIDFYGALKIIDISDLQSPLILSSVNLRVSTYNYRIKNLILSSDEKTLYTSNSKDLEIIDVTDPSSPKVISQTKSQLFDDFQTTSHYFKTSLALSEKTKTMYIGGIGLQVYDISDPKQPILLKAIKNYKTRHFGFARNEICLSQDEKILFVANGTLDVYNITNPKDMRLLYSFKTESSPRSIFLSEDSKTACLLGTSDKEEIIYEEADISSLDSFNVKKTVKLDHKSISYSPRFLAISPSKSKIFIFAHSVNQGAAPYLLVFDRIKETAKRTENNLIGETFAMDFRLDGKTLITGSSQQFMTIELFLDYPNTQIFSASKENLINNISFPLCGSLEMSGDGQYLFALCKTQATHTLTIWDVKNLSAPRSWYDTQTVINQIQFIKNYQAVYLLSNDFIMVLDITNRDEIELKQKYDLKDRKKSVETLHFISSSNEKTGFLLRAPGEEEGYVSFMNLSNNGEVFLTLNLEFDVWEGKLILKDDDKTLVVVSKQLVIYDISDILSPRQVAALPFGVNEPDPYLRSYRLSPDEKTLYIQTYDQNGFSKLKIYNMSISASPQLISEKYFPKIRGEAPLSLSPDLNTGFLYQLNSLIKLNLTDLNQPQVIGVVPLVKSKQESVLSYVLSPDGKTVYAVVGNEIRVINMEIEYSLFLKRERFLLGQKYSDSIAMLHLNASDYNLMDIEEYKIIKLSLLDMKVAPTKVNLEMKTSPLPSWMIFDRESNTLTVESKKQRDLGTYTLCSNFSLKISREVFDNLGNAEHPVSSLDLWAWLISLDYVDPQLYLTANFGGIDTFFLPSNFTLYQEEIYSILKRHHVETCTSFEVVSSLGVENKSLLTVSSLSTSPIKVEVKLEPKNGVDAKFVSKTYGSLLPVLKENKTKISLEGSLKEINGAINSLVVNFENGTASDANMMVNDGLNPSVLTGLKNISSYFKSNRPPGLNNNVDKTLQEQIDLAGIQTGKYFTFTLSDDIFEDEYAEKNLEYEFVMANKNTAFPTWLNFNGLTLKGTPPEEISERDVDLVLIAKNEFKQYGVPFNPLRIVFINLEKPRFRTKIRHLKFFVGAQGVKLHISISTAFLLKLVLRYSPYILTLIGLFVSANKIFNILKKGFYKHSKEFYVGVGQEISENLIFPISFVKEEQKQSRLILKKLRDINVADFVDQDQQILDKEKITFAIKETIQKMSVDIKKQITLYPNPIIDQIIVNKFIWMQLNSASEVKTRSLFEDLKADCLEVVDRDRESSASGFVINQNKLMKRIGKQPGPGERDDTLNESLISNDSIDPGVNINLLKEAILAYAFENHSINIAPVDIDVGVKQKVPSNFLFKFLKLDLRDIYLNEKYKMNYGIKYRIMDDKLCFYGVSQNYFKGKTLVVQIKTRKQRIMKEIWIHGVSNDFDEKESFMIRDEQEARDQGYEIY